MDNLIWVGPRDSDIAGCEELFSGCISFFSSRDQDMTFADTPSGCRINHNDERANRLVLYNAERMMAVLAEKPGTRFMFYNTLFANQLGQELEGKVICRNLPSLLSVLDDKGETRLAASRIIPTVPYASVHRQSGERLVCPSRDCDVVVQVRKSSGGFGTYVVRHSETDGFLAAHPEIKDYIVSPYYENAPSINIHFFIESGRIFALPGSVQIVREVSGKLLYLGADFDAYGEIDRETVELAKEYGKKFLKRYAADSYTGVIGIDYLLVDGAPLFTEANPRFQASTPLLNRALLDAGLPTLQEMQIGAFSGKSYAEALSKAEVVKTHGSFISYIPEVWNRPDIDIGRLAGHEGIESVDPDGYSQGQPAEPEAHLFKVTFSRRITRIVRDGSMEIHENALEEDSDIARRILNGDLRAIKVSLINQGIRISRQALEQQEIRAGGLKEGVFSSVDIVAFGQLHINCPYGIGLSRLSPWLIDMGKEGLALKYRGREISPVTIDKPDCLSERKTSSDTRFSTYCFMAADRLRVHHARSCFFKNAGIGCRFCEVLPNREAFAIEDVFEAVDAYVQEAEFRHFLIGGGSGEPNYELNDVIEIVRHIRARDNRPIYLMCLPPSDLGFLDRCKDAGVNEVAFNLEVYDRAIARELMPGKGAIPLSQYLDALEHAVELWGNSGKVRSLFVVGLEPEESLLSGVRRLCSIGVAPILSALRPLPGTPLSQRIPPSNRWLLEVFQRSEEICAKFGLALGPDCPACQNNVLALPPGIS